VSFKNEAIDGMRLNYSLVGFGRRHLATNSLATSRYAVVRKGNTLISSFTNIDNI